MTGQNRPTTGGNTPAVFALSRPSRCYSCDRKLETGEIVQLKERTEDREVYCQGCAGLEHFEVVPSGNARLTRLAGKYSSIRYVVMRWSELWKCYERQGILVEKQALERARKELP